MCIAFAIDCDSLTPLNLWVHFFSVDLPVDQGSFYCRLSCACGYKLYMCSFFTTYNESTVIKYTSCDCYVCIHMIHGSRAPWNCTGWQLYHKPLIQNRYLTENASVGHCVEAMLMWFWTRCTHDSRCCTPMTQMHAYNSTHITCCCIGLSRLKAGISLHRPWQFDLATVWVVIPASCSWHATVNLQLWTRSQLQSLVLHIQTCRCAALQRCH
jgi:hypothetical protein